MNNISDHFMKIALQLASRGLGIVAPNPAVGAVVVKAGRIIGTGYTARGGRPHAETQALAMAGEAAKGATLYVTLEPCSHHGKTGPCAQAIIDAGITHVVSACGDSNPKVAGAGYAMLRAAGITVTEGLCEAEARALNAGFLSVMERGKPLVTLKMATSLDGLFTTSTGESKWITGEQARNHGHLLRATHDAILTGIGTVLADNPSLTCRLPGREQDSPKRIVMDSKLRTPVDAKVFPAWIITSEESMRQKDKVDSLTKAGAKLFAVPDDQGRPSLHAALKLLAQHDITRLLVEAGPSLSREFMEQKLADRLYWFRAPLFIGTTEKLASAPHFVQEISQSCGKDALEKYIAS